MPIDVTAPSNHPELPLDVLPAFPGDGTTECDECRCSWRVRVLDAQRGDYDANWMLGASAHCRMCRERARSWLGLRVRSGELVDEVEPIFNVG